METTLDKLYLLGGVFLVVIFFLKTPAYFRSVMAWLRRSSSSWAPLFGGIAAVLVFALVIPAVVWLVAYYPPLIFPVLAYLAGFTQGLSSGQKSERRRCAALAERVCKETLWAATDTDAIPYTLADAIRKDSKGGKLHYPN